MILDNDTSLEFANSFKGKKGHFSNYKQRLINKQISKVQELKDISTNKNGTCYNNYNFFEPTEE